MSAKKTGHGERARKARAVPRMPSRRRELASGGLVCGVDEAGCAPLAGPVVAAAVILPHGAKPRRLRGLTDSKLLAREARERLYAAIRAVARVGVGVATAAEIDRLNILRADLLAMRRAVEALGIAPERALVDGRAAPALGCPVETVIDGDARCLCIAAASVVAKVTRDRLMRELAGRFPGYGWATNVGYGTDEHYLGLLRLGATPHHRRSFAPLRTLFAESNGRLARLRFEPLDRLDGGEGLTLLELRRDLHALFDRAGRHLGLVKGGRGGWRLRALGYGAGGEPRLGAGPLAHLDGAPLAAPETQALQRLLDED